MRLQTWAMRAKEATSATAKSRRMCERISSGISASGHGFCGEKSVSGGSGSIRSCEKSSTSSLRVAGMAGAGGSCEADAFVWFEEVDADAVGAGLGFVNMDAGKCFFL